MPDVLSLILKEKTIECMTKCVRNIFSRLKLRLIAVSFDYIFSSFILCIYCVSL